MSRPELYPVKKVIGFDSPMLDAIEKWRSKQKPIPTVSDAMRRLVELGLTVKAKPTRPTAASANRAKELAGKVIDTLTPAATDAEEKASRKRRLLKGPEEFREVRRDRAKATK